MANRTLRLLLPLVEMEKRWKDVGKYVSIIILLFCLIVKHETDG